jgi:hypothetical protein
MSKYIINIILLLLLSVATWAQTDTLRNTSSDKWGTTNNVMAADTISNVRRSIGKAIDSSRINTLDSAVLVIDTLVADTLIADTIAKDTNIIKRVVTRDTLHQVRLGIDLMKPIMNQFYKTRNSYEFEADYYFRKEIYFVAEGGWGSSGTIGDTNYRDLQYESSNTFLKVGVNKSMLTRLGPGDWDMAFIGARYGIAFIQRSAATYKVNNPFWGASNGTLNAQQITGHWLEVTAGARLEIYRGIFAGWNIRGKFRVNRKPFRELPPLYIAGYGQGDKNSIFDFNFYLSYAIRWR